ncbi:transglutaminase superfamily protein [Nocardiopsis sp. Huas11]|uniref:DUF3488 and transglutaminase-like domain-containing protein n=1 Tax=Nocardiopsis sp. Huas11 TaxID=2183912 RepID=UPI000EB0474C|nr:transglutaminase domain-containing protein [Nocardiopsis sp. Huas11]RKS06179.1 transglutaminase superfamily protein [Nocardiopsis sp. Huas11]
MVTVTRPRSEEAREVPGPAADSSRGHPAGPVPPARVGAAPATALVLAAAAGSVAIAPGYALPAQVYAVVPACALLGVLVTLGLRRRMSASAGLLAGLAVPLAVVVACSVWLPGEGTGVVGSAVEAVLHSGARILTSTAPTPVNADTLALPVLATWLTAAASALAWCGRRRALALVPGLLLLVGAVVLNGPVAPPGFPAIGMLTVAAVLLMSASMDRSEADRPDPAGLSIEVDTAGAAPPGRLRRNLATGVVAALTAGAVVFAGPVLLAGWNAEPGDPREAMSPPMDPQAALNPLGYLAGWAADADEPLLTVTADDPVSLRWVTLADFTGTTWLPQAGYRSAGGTFPEPVPPLPHATERAVEIAVGEDLPGGWVPVVGSPSRIDLASPGYDAFSGTVVNMDGPVAGTRYQVTGDVADWRADELARASTPADALFEDYRELPAGAPPVLNEVVAAVASEGAPYARARALADYLKESHTFDPETPGGHGYANVAAILAQPGAQGGGTSEQFASAFALLARAAGLPSRVAVGFGPGTDGGAGAHTVYTGDAVAWGEVYFEGVGWVPFSVTPGVEGGDTADEAPQDAAEPEEAENPADEEPSTDDAHDVSAPREDRNRTPWWVVAAVAGGLVALVLAVPVLRLLRRRRRLGSGPPARRVMGAWRELREDLRMCEVTVPPGNTVADTVDLARGLLPERARAWAEVDLARLRRTVNAVGFSAGAGVPEEQASAIADGIRRQSRVLRLSRGRARALTWWFDPRPLFWRDPAGRRRGRERQRGGASS